MTGTGIELPLTYNQRTRVATFYGADQWRRPPVVFALRWAGDADVPLLNRTLDLVVRRHVALRTYFPDADGPARCVAPEAVDIALAEAEQLDGLDAPFDVGEPLLIRAGLTREDGSVTLGFAVDHTIFDAGSADAFLADFATVYCALAEGEDPAALDVVVSDFSLFAGAEREWIDSEAGAAAWEYWRQPWEAYGPFPAMPFARVSEAATFTWAREIDGFQSRARKLRVSPFMLSVAAMAWTLKERFEAEDSAVIVMNSRRQSRDSLRGVGNYATKQLLATDLRGCGTFEDAVGAVRGRVAGAMRHGMMPYEVLVERVRPDKAEMRPDSPYLAFTTALGAGTHRLGDRVASVVALGGEVSYAAMSPALFVSVEGSGSGAAGSVKLVGGFHHARFDPGDVGEFLDGTLGELANQGADGL